MQHTPPDGRQALGEYLALILDPAVLDDPAALDAQFRAAAADAVLGVVGHEVLDTRHGLR